MKKTQSILKTAFIAAIVVCGSTLPSAFAASQTWTNAPVSTSWTNVLNWVGKAAPGDINVTTANTVNGDIVTFSAPLLGGIGGAGNPIVPDDATVINGRSRRIDGIVFDTTNCGPYVIYSPSPAVVTDGTSTLTTGYLYVSHDITTNALGETPVGSIRIRNSVTNSQAVLVPMLVSLPSSTAGIYALVNNSTNPGVTLTINSITHAGATTRATTFILDGTNTADNVVTNLSEGVGNGTGGFTKQGPGRWIIAGPSTFPAASPLNINEGTLVVKDAGAFGVATTASVTNATLRIDGVSLTTSTLTLRSNGVVRANGSCTVNGITVVNTLNNNVTIATTSASDVMTVGNAANKVTSGAVTATLHMSGPGTVLFGFANNYVGKYSLDSGTNQLSDPGALGSAANYNINAGAVLDLTLFGGGGYILTTKAFSANGTSTNGPTASTILADPTATVDFGSKAINLTFTPTSTSGDLIHPVFYAPQGTLAFNGNAVIVNNASGSPLNAGTYLLARAGSGNMTSSGAFVTLVAGSGLVAGMVGEIVVSGGDMNLLVYAYTPKPLVWTGGDISLPTTWDRQNTTNWLNGVTPSVFNIYDGVTFNAVGSTNPTVSLVSTLVPGSVTVNTISNDYTFSTTGSGQIAGGAGLLKTGTNILFLNTANTYSGGTTVSNGTIKIGIADAIPSTGLGDVTNLSPSVIDLNGFNDTIGALNGNGTVDVTGGGSSVLSVGNNDNNGTFSGILQNTAGTLGLTKVGLGTEILTRSNSYTGTTDLELGTLKPLDPYSFGPSAALVVNGGTLELATNIFLSSLAGTGGTIANTTASSTNTLIVQGTATTTFAGSIVNGAGKISLKVLGGSLRMLAANTYTNGTFVGSGATFQIHNAPAAVTGPLVASNNATLGLSGGSSSPATPTSVTTVDGATVTFTSGAEGEIWGSQFIGSATATNRFTSNVSAGGIASFSNFLGTVQFALTSGNFRFFNGGGVSGGDNTTFEFISGNVHTRDAQTVSLGYIKGGSSTCGIGGQGATIATWAIGAKNLDCSFQGYISGSNNLVKMGSGKLVLDGFAATTNTDNATFTNYVYTPVINYANNTTVSNGTLSLSVPNDLINSPLINLATTNAVLDASNMGYVSNFTDVNGANSALITNGTLTVVAATAAAGTPQVLAGFGVVKGNGVTNNGTINPGNAAAGGTLSISNSLAINAGATNYFDLSDDLTGLVKPSDLIVVQGDVNLAGNSVIGIGALNGVVKVGKYPLIKYGGSLKNEGGVIAPGTTSIPNLALGGVFTDTSRATMILSNAPGELDLVVVSLNTKNLTWAGDGISNRWDVVNSFNWTNTPAPIQFYQLDFVTFDNTATNFNVSLQGTVVPSGITVNSSSNYVFSTPGIIGGVGTLVKTGTGTLLITNGANIYTGGTIVSNGLLSVGTDSGNNQNDQALGSGPITVSGGELRFGGNGGTVVTHVITNAVILNGGSIKAQDGVQRLTNSTVTVAAGGGSLVTVFATKNLVLDSPLIGTGNLTVSAVPAGTNVAGGQVILNNATNTISGSVSIATNGNLALVNAAGLSNCVAIDVQLGGILDVTGRTNVPGTLTLLSGQTLKGNGVVRGNIIMNGGSTLSPGASIGTLTITNAGTTVTLNGTTVMEINRSATPNSDRLAATTNVFGGTITVNNLGGTLQLNDTFTLFSSITNRGSFAIINLPPLSAGLGWSNSLASNGKLTVIAVINTNAFTLSNSVSGNVLTLSWPADHTGYRLQVQTNTLATGLGTNWSTVGGSTGVNTTNFIINPNNGSVFYRLIYP